jgi:hypothetical protein
MDLEVPELILVCKCESFPYGALRTFTIAKYDVYITVLISKSKTRGDQNTRPE